MMMCPSPLASGSVKAIDRRCAYWAFRIVKQVARGLVFDRCLEMIRQRQRTWEERAAKLLEAGADNMDELLEALALDVVADW